MAIKSNGLLESDYQYSGYTRTPEEQRKQLDYWENVIAAKEQAIEELNSVIRDKNVQIETLIVEIEDLKVRNNILARYRTANKVSLSELPEILGESEQAKITKTLELIEKHNLIITK